MSRLSTVLWDCLMEKEQTQPLGPHDSSGPGCGQVRAGPGWCPRVWLGWGIQGLRQPVRHCSGSQDSPEGGRKSEHTLRMTRPHMCPQHRSSQRDRGDEPPETPTGGYQGRVGMQTQRRSSQETVIPLWDMVLLPTQGICTTVSLSSSARTKASCSGGGWRMLTSG